MDSFEINKIITAVLLVVLVIFGVGKISDLVFEVKKPDIDADSYTHLTLPTKRIV